MVYGIDLGIGKPGTHMPKGVRAPQAWSRQAVLAILIVLAVCKQEAYLVRRTTALHRSGPTWQTCYPIGGRQ